MVPTPFERQNATPLISFPCGYLSVLPESGSPYELMGSRPLWHCQVALGCETSDTPTTSCRSRLASWYALELGTTR